MSEIYYWFISPCSLSIDFKDEDESVEVNYAKEQVLSKVVWGNSNAWGNRYDKQFKISDLKINLEQFPLEKCNYFFGYCLNFGCCDFSIFPSLSKEKPKITKKDEKIIYSL